MNDRQRIPKLTKSLKEWEELASSHKLVDGKMNADVMHSSMQRAIHLNLTWMESSNISPYLRHRGRGKCLPYPRIVMKGDMATMVAL